MSEERIVRYTMDEIKAKLAAGEGRMDRARIDAMTEEEIEQDALADAAEHGYDPEWYQRAVPVLAPEATPEGVEKRRISIRLDEDILAFFQQAGRGYQTRINDTLRIAMNKITGQENHM